VAFKNLNKLRLITQEEFSFVSDEAFFTSSDDVCVTQELWRKGKLEGGYLTTTDIWRSSGWVFGTPRTTCDPRTVRIQAW